jgi:hypothetical protein
MSPNVPKCLYTTLTFYIKHICFLYYLVSNNHAIARLVFIFRLQNFTQESKHINPNKLTDRQTTDDKWLQNWNCY